MFCFFVKESPGTIFVHRLSLPYDGSGYDFFPLMMVRKGYTFTGNLILNSDIFLGWRYAVRSIITLITTISIIIREEGRCGKRLVH